MIQRHAGWTIRLVALVGLLLPPVHAAAADRQQVTTEDLQQMREEFLREVQGLRSENAELRSRLEAYENTRAEERERLDEIELAVEKSEGLTAGYDDGFYIKSADDRFRMDFFGVVQFQGNVFENNDVPTRAGPVFNTGLQGVNRDDTFFMRRMRLKVSGHLFSKNLRWAVQVGFEGETGNLFDAYVDYQWREWAQVRFGEFKPPFSMERLEWSGDLETIERAAIVEILGMGRRMGVKFFGSVLEGRLSYDLMLANRAGFEDEGRNVPDNNDDKAFIGQVVAKPFNTSDNRWWKGLELRGAVATGNNAPSASSGLTVHDLVSILGSRNRVRMTVPYIGGRQTSYDLGLSWVIDRFRLKGEYLFARVGRRDIPVTSAFPYGALALHPITISGGYVQASYVLYDGESHKVIPVLKYETMHVRGDNQVVETFVTEECDCGVTRNILTGRFVGNDYNNDFQALTAGVSWYINPRFKIMGNWVFEWMGEDLIGPTRLRRGENTNQNIFMVRGQLKF